MLGNMHNQERRDSLVFGDMRGCGEIAVLRRVVAEVLAVAKPCVRQSVNAPTGLRRPDDRRQVDRVAIDGHTA
jgi:hypothetical protein